MKEVEIEGLQTAVDWNSFCRKLVIYGSFKTNLAIGGPEIIVEIDESKIGRKKYNRGHAVEGQWIFGDVERISGKCFMVPVESRNSETLMPLIKRYILPGSIVVSDCWKVLKSETENTDLENDKRLELDELLRTLNATERFLVAKYFCKLPWNIGSLKVVDILQKLRILTATEYILSCQDSEDVQLILNDFLESKFELVTNLLVNTTFDSAYSLRLNTLLEECLENLFKDLLVKPELNDLSFLNHVKELVPAEIILTIIYKVLSTVLGLYQTNIKEAFLKFSSWINEGVDDLKFPQDLYKQLLSEYIEGSLHFLLKCSSIDTFREWKFYLIMLQTVSSNNNEFAGPLIKRYLKERLKQCALVPCKHTIMHVLLTARAATANTMDVTKNLNNYAEWYKSNIGDMKYFLKVEEFQNILALLEQIINYEMEVDYLEIHTIIVISPPVLCGNLVKTYKSKCKQRLQQIKKGNLQIDALNESIVIEDSN